MSYTIRVLMLILLIDGLIPTAYAQGTYKFENEALDIIAQNKKAKTYAIKMIRYYSGFVDSVNKGTCTKKEIYGADGNLVEEIEYPNSNKEKQTRRFVYDGNNLIEIHRTLKKRNGASRIIYIGYDSLDRLKSMHQRFTANNSSSDTVFYYYAADGRYDYKTWGRDDNHKMFIRYNACGKIEYVESFPLDHTTIKLDSNNCVCYVELYSGEHPNKNDISFHRRTCTEQCKTLTYYTQYAYHNDWMISTDTNQYNTDFLLARNTYAFCRAKTKKKCLRKFRVARITEYEYDSNGLLLFAREYDRNNKLTTTHYREYEYR